MKNISIILILVLAAVWSSKSAAQTVILKADTVEVACSAVDTFEVPIRLDNFTNVSGLQFTLKWDTAHLDYVAVKMLHPQFMGVGFDTSAATINGGKLTFAWTDLGGVSLPSNTILFKVCYRRISGPITPIQFVNDPTAIAVFDNTFSEVPYAAHNGAVKPIDNTPPTISCPANVITGNSGPIPIQNIAPTAADNCTGPNVGWSSSGATVANFPNDPDASGALFNVGSSIVTYTVTDAGSNTATCSFEILIEFSVTSTDLTLIGNVGTVATCGGTVSVDVLAFNHDSIAGLQFSMSWPASALEFTSISNMNAALAYNVSNFNTTQSQAGVLTFAWTSSSVFGNTIPDGTTLFTLNFNVAGPGTVSFSDNPTVPLAFTGTVFPPEEVPLILANASITVVDTEAPSITCPADLTVQAPGTVAVQNIAPVNVDDNCSDPNVGWSSTGATVSSNPNDPDASSALFNIGTSTVTYTATDSGDNTASCSFNVTVEFANTTTDLTLIANSTNASCSGTFSVDVTVLNFETIAGLQFSMNWNPALYQYTSVSNFNGTLGIANANFGIADVNNGTITFAWTSGDLNGQTLANGGRLFTLNFNLVGSSASSVAFGDVPTDRLAFDGGTFDELVMLTVDGQISVVDNVAPVISCPANINTDADQGQLSAQVTGLAPSSLSDNCDTSPSLSYVAGGATTNNGQGNADGVYNAGVTTVVYTATDDAGNTATCSFTVTVDAGTPLTLIVPDADLGCQTPSQIEVCVEVQDFTDIKFAHFWLNWDPTSLNFVAKSSEFAGLNLQNSMFFNFADAPNGLLKFFGGSQTWPDIPSGSAFFCLTFDVLPTATFPLDITFSGPIEAVNSNFENVAVATEDGTLAASLDNTPPTIACPSNTTLTVFSAMSCDIMFDPDQPTVSDDCGTVADVVQTPPGNIFSLGATPVTYTATDEAGNSATCVFVVNVTELIPPSTMNCPANVTVAADANCMGIATWTAPDFQDNCSVNGITVVSSHLPDTEFPLGVTPVNYTATDNSGNSGTCNFTVEVRDVTSPSITCPPNQSITPVDGCAAVVNFSAPVVLDNCDAAPDIACSNNSGEVFSGITTVTCTAVDDGGNVAQCAFTVTVADAIAPSFVGNCPTDQTIVSAGGNCGANPTWTVNAASDNCDQDVTVISAPASGTFLGVQGSPHVITFTATDDFGNSATCTFTVTVTDATAPTLVNCPTLPLLVFLPPTDCDTVLNWTNPTVNDNCGAGLVQLTSNLQPGTNFVPGDTMVVYTATDASGNTATCSFNVTVRDVVPPVLSGCPTQPIVINNGNPCGVEVFFPLPTGMDNCTPEDELVYTSDYLPGDTFDIGTIIFPFRVTDASGNFDECDITITVNGQSPGLTNVPANITATGCDAQITWIPPVPVGFCPPVTIDSTHAFGTFPFGTTTVIYTASDSSNNVATASFTVTISENVAPVFTCPESPIQVSAAGAILSDPDDFIQSANPSLPACDGVFLTFNNPAATDNCVTPTVTQLEGLTSGMSFPLGFNNLVFRAVDSSGNQAQCAVFIEVVALPELAPVVNPNPGCAGETITITAANLPGATYTWTGPVASTSNVLTIPSLSAQNDGQYIVSASLNGCQLGPDTAEVYLTVTPVAESDVDDYFIDPGTTVTFGSVLENDFLSPAFDFEVCDTSALSGLDMHPDGTFSYTAGEVPGMVSFTYTVCSKSCNVSDQAAVTITIRDTKCVFIPNIITPNGDDTNDWFVIPCIDTRLFGENSLVVYNQWGDKVYEAAPYSNDPNDAWRGTLDGEPGKDLPDGVYYYIFKPSPTLAPMKGFVEIFR